jgi:hypothetical protein
VRQRTRLKNQVQAILHRNLVSRCPFADLFGVKGRCWLSDSHLPADEHHAVQALVRQLDFHGQERRVIDAALGRIALERPEVRRLMDHPADLGREGEKRRDVLPGVLPGLHDRREPRAPGLIEGLQRGPARVGVVAV